MIREWTLARNCSLSPGQVARAYGLLCCASSAVAIGFLLHGIWIILAFTLSELALVGLALLVYARHALDREQVLLSESCLLVAATEAGQVREARLDPLWTRVLEPGAGRRALIRLESRGVAVEIGRHVSEATRRRIARELRQALRGISIIP